MSAALAAMGTTVRRGGAVKTLSKAYDLVKDGGTIILCSDVDQGSTTVTISRNVTITSQSQSGKCFAINRDLNSTGTEYAAMFSVVAGGTLTLRNITLEGQKSGATITGHAIEITGGTLNLEENTTIRNFIYKNGNGNGGAICQNGGTVNLKPDASITGNWASAGGGGVMIHSGQFNMTGGTISGNFAGSYGGGVYLSASGSFTMTGGSITGNGAAAGGAGINVDYNNLTVGGTAVVDGNYLSSGGQQSWTLGTTASNVYLGIRVAKISSSTHFANGAKIGVSKDEAPTENLDKKIANGAKDGDQNYFFYDGGTDDASVKYKEDDGGSLWLSVSTESGTDTGTHDHPVCGDSSCEAHGGALTWTGISSLDEIDGAGNYYLKNDVTLSNTWNCTFRGEENDDEETGPRTCNVNLCLNGKTITGANGDAAIEVYGVSLAITDCHTGNDAGKITHKTGETGSGIINEGSLTLWNGSITGNTAASGFADSNGGGVSNKRGTFIMNGGTISANSAGSNGGGVYNDSGNFTMTGGSISGNSAGSVGGVYNVNSECRENCNFTMSGGSITGNNATSVQTYSVGGVVCYSVDLIMSGTAIVKGNKVGGTSDNSGMLTGGTENNVYLYNGATISVSDSDSMSTGAAVGITVDAPKADLNVVTGTNNTTGFFSDDEKYTLVSNGNTGLMLKEGSASVTISDVKLLNQISGMEMNNNTKIYDGKAVACSGGTTSETDVHLNYTWQAKNGDEYSTLDKAPKDAGSYRLHVEAVKDGRTCGTEDYDFTITAKELTVNAAVKNKNYDGTDDAEFNGTPALVGVVEADQVTLTNGVPTFASANVGDGISINFTAFSISGEDASNYTLIQPSGIKANINAYNATGDEYSANTGEWTNQNFAVTAKNGWKLSLTNTASGSWVDSLTGTAESSEGELTFYVKNEKDGYISEAITKTYKIDKTAPTGQIKIGERNVWEKFLETISFNLFYKNAQSVTITASDSESGVAETQYLVTADDLTIEALKDKKFTTYTEAFDINPDEKLIVYVKITDKAGNITYLRSDGIVLDATAPVISGAESGKTYCAAVTLSITDEYLDTVRLNGEEVTLTGGKLTIGPKEGNQTVVASDKAGNSTSITVTVNSGHSYGTAKYTWAEDGKSCIAEKECSACKDKVTETATVDNKQITSEVKEDATCEAEGTTTYTATFEGEGFAAQSKDVADIAATGHTEVTDKAVEPTCTETGKTEGKHCSVCDKVLVEQQPVDALGHDYTVQQSDDKEHWKKCSRCDSTEAKEAHKWNAGTVTTAPTTSSAGVRTYTCTVCSATKTESIAKLPSGGGSVSKPDTGSDSVVNKADDKNTGTEATTTATIKPSAATTAADGKKTTTTKVDTVTADKIVEKAVSNTSKEVVVNAATAATVTETAAGTVTEIALPEKTVQALSQKTEASVTIRSDAAEVTLNKAAVDGLAAQAGDDEYVKLVVETVKQESKFMQVDLKLVTSRGTVTDFRGGDVSVKVKLNDTLATKEVTCVYINNRGLYNKVSGTKNSDGTYTFVTGHFSSYAIMALDEADDIIAKQTAKVKELAGKIQLKARSVKTPKGSIKVSLKITKGTDSFKALEDMGYTLKYQFYRSTEMRKNYKAKFETNGAPYTNTDAKKGTRYYYKARIVVYDTEGNMVLKTDLQKCWYATRIR